MPKKSRFAVTMIAGALATLAGLFPAIAMKLLGFVALYGMLLMPMGAVVFVDFWLIKKFGMKDNYAELTNKSFNWAAGLTWFVTLAICWWLVRKAGVQIFFVSLPGWFIAAVLYLVLSYFYQRQLFRTNVCRAFSQFVSWLSLIVLVAFSVLYLAGAVELEIVKTIFWVVTIVWFISAALWMLQSNSSASEK